jgi:hypothetical protein
MIFLLLAREIWLRFAVPVVAASLALLIRKLSGGKLYMRAAILTFLIVFGFAFAIWWGVIALHPGWTEGWYDGGGP